MSREHSGRAVMPSAAKSSCPKAKAKTKTKSKDPDQIDWNKVKVFAKPEYTLPFHLQMFTNGRKSADYVAPQPWLQVAIESGLVEMASPSADYRGGMCLKPIGDAPEARMQSGEFDLMMVKELQRALADLEKLELQISQVTEK